MVGFSHSKSNTYDNFCVPKYTANHFQKPMRPYFYCWPSHLTPEMFVIFLCPPKSPKYFWHFIFQEDVIDATSGNFHLQPRTFSCFAAFPLYPVGDTWRGRKRSPVPLVMGGGRHPHLPGAPRASLAGSAPRQPCIAARCSAGPLRSHACLVQATPAESRQWRPSPSGFLNLSRFA